jgi:hypothetical protein
MRIELLVEIKPAASTLFENYFNLRLHKIVTFRQGAAGAFKSEM